MVLLIITITVSSNLIGSLTALFFTNHLGCSLILLITCMITDRIGLHSVLLPILILLILNDIVNDILFP